MGRAKRMERVVALTKILVDHPQQLFSFSYFCKKFRFPYGFLRLPTPFLQNFYLKGFSSIKISSKGSVLLRFSFISK